MIPNNASEALELRISVQEENGSNDINKWISDIVGPKPGEVGLDLGCGTGKQSVDMSLAVGDSGYLVCVDIDQVAIASFLSLPGQHNRICVHGSMDDVENIGSRYGHFDFAYSAFALYEANDPAGVLKGLRNVLNNNGRFFVCGPKPENNSEILGLYSKVAELPDPLLERTRRMNDIIPQAMDAIFRNVDEYAFDNPIRFRSVETVMDYFRGSTFGTPFAQLEDAFKGVVEAEFKESGEFVTTKRVVGYLGNK